MLAKSIMSTQVVSISLSTSVKDIARTLYEHRISAVPVVDPQKRLIGIVSEGDLIFREELGTEHKRSWWLSFFADSERDAYDYVKSHARTANDIMTSHVISVTEETPVQEIADLLQRHQIKRVPVLRSDKIVGIVSRANLIQRLAVGSGDIAASEVNSSDQTLRENLLNTLHDALGIQAHTLNVIVNDGVVHLLGFVDGKQERKAVQVAAENINGVRQVDNHLTVSSSVPAYGY